MYSLFRKATAVLLGLVGLSALAAISTFSLTANNLAGLRGMEIRPFGDFAIDPGEKLMLTAEGDYTSYTVPLRAAWFIVRGEDLGYFEEVRCDSADTCTFHAGSEGGEVTIRAEASGFVDEAVIHIRAPKPPKPVENPFNDDIPSWAGEPIVGLRDAGIINGYDNGTYGAGDLLTRGQLITIFYRTLERLHLAKNPGDCGIVYNDIPRDHYAYAAACIFRQNRWTDSLSTLSPNEPVSRGETASLINRVMGPGLLDTEGLRLGKILADGPYFDDVSLSHQYYGDTAVTKALGLMKGNPDNTFGPGETLNRAEAATIFWRLMEKM